MTESAIPKPRWRERVKALKNTLPILRLVWESSPSVVIASLVSRVIVALLPLAILAVTKVIIDRIYGFTTHQRPYSNEFWWWVGLEFALAAVISAFSRVIDFCDVVLADKYMRHVSVRIMEHAAKLDLTSYEDPIFYDKMERARVQGTDRIIMIQAAGRLVQQVITTVSLAAALFFYSPILLLALVACQIPAFMGETHFAFLGYSLNFKQTPAKREMEYLRIVGGSKEAAKELKLFGLGDFLVNRFSTLSYSLHDENVHLASRRLYVGMLLTLLSTVGYYGAYAFAIYEAAFQIITIGSLTFLTGAIAGSSSNIQQVFSTFSTLADQALFVNDLVDFFQVQPTVTSKPGALAVPRPIRLGFEFKNVSFSYPGSSRLVLRDVNFKLEPGQRLALVGENGQGKTTIVKLLSRLYDPTAGQILLDGVDLREYDLEDLWREIGVIFQDFMRYDMTVSENISIGQINELNNQFRIQSAARKSMAEPLIRKLPNGYQQMLGRRFETGVDLSGGEWQKIALARAYMREAQLLILDEPTAALDARAEHEVFERFADLTRGKMSVLISHRFSTVRMADRVMVLDGGVIAEEGHHDQLMRQGGRYAEMFELQAASYR